MSILTAAEQTPVREPIPPGKHHQRIQRLRDQERQRRFTIVAMMLIASGLVWIGLIGIVDYLFELNLWARLIAWGCIIAAIITTALAMRHWLRFEAGDAVCEAENAWPEIGQRLRTSHDYQTRPAEVASADPILLRALERQTQDQVLDQPTQPLGKAWPIGTLAGVSFVIVIAWLGAFVLSPGWRVASGRMMLLPIHYSTIQLEPLPQQIELGEDLIVRLRVDGRPIESAIVKYRNGSETTWNEVPIATEKQGALVGELSAVIAGCQQDLDLQILARPLGDDIHHVAVRLPLVVETWEATVQPPSYTGLPPVDAAEAGVSIPEGSHVVLAATYNRAPKSVDVTFAPEETAATATTLTDATAQLALDAGTRPIEIAARAVAGDGAVSESELLLNVVSDRPPAIRFSAPDEDGEAIPTSELRFSLEVFDDYGIGSIEVRYRIDDGPEQTLWQSAGDTSGNAFSHSITLPLETLNLSFPQAITYYAIATDNRAPEPQRITSDLRFIDIRPFSRDYEFSEGQCNCQGECLSLEKLIRQQREILGRTFVAAQRNSIDESEINTAGGKLSSQQQDVRDQTETLKQALEAKVGPMLELDSALDWMSDAIEDLDSGKIAAGQTSEEKALAGLIAARQNLRKILKQGSSQSQLVRQLDKLQIQPKKESEQKPEKEPSSPLADLRQRIEQLAEKQESFCQSAQACLQSGASGTSSGNPNPTPTPQQLAEQQRQSETEARDIGDQLSKGEFGDLAPSRAREAAESIKQSAQSLPGGDSDKQSGVQTWSESETEGLEQSIANASDAARQLRRLSEHLGRRHNPDFEDKLAAAKRTAEQLSESQERLSDTLTEQDQATPLAEQSELALRTEELDDLVKQLSAESTQQDWSVQDTLAKQVAQNPPRQAASLMKSAAQSIRSGQAASAKAAGSRASETLKQFAEGLKQVQQSVGPAQLEALTEAEKQAAALLKELRRASTSAQQAMAVAQSQRFATSLGSLTINDPELADAVNRIPEFRTAPTSMTEGIRAIDEVLQRRIQEAILSGVLQQADGPVPPEYADMVDEYYRTLSEDVE